MPGTVGTQLFWLFTLAIPVACVVRTVVYEEVFSEVREYCKSKSKNCNHLFHRKFFYLFTCEYCFSHWVSLFAILFTGFRLLIDDWRGYVIALFSLVLIANFYLNLYARLRLEIQQAKVETRKMEQEVRAQSSAPVEETADA
jgi:hypothetical protein